MLRCATRYRLWPRSFGPPAILSSRWRGIEKQCWIPVAHHDRRAFGLDILSAILIPPTVFGGLLGVATTALANLLETETDGRKLTAISGLVLETPFIDLRSMLVALYPQRFLPYRYLYPFLRSTWDSNGALQQVAAAKPTRLQKILILQAGSDEIVPDGQAELLRHVCAEGGLDAELKVIEGALHTEIMAKHEGRKMIAEFLKNISKERCT